MVTMNEDGSIEHIDVPGIIRKTGIIPDGFSVDLIFDPIILAESLVERGLRFESQLPPEMLQGLKDRIMDVENLCIVPAAIQQQKLELFASSMQDMKEAGADGDEDEGEGGREALSITERFERASSQVSQRLDIDAESQE
ncbi:hypothetical protein EST38_g4067 [Candolleomyces aberdarensis]|uniref:Uncharacterized protein n=1 Tax=Candolleomyces aberdarensis TaxID=2316362 RepID=A0A4Q2DRF5_9AGAR|nr:hypothetical protein EST38_g4067 [Candolleomyces aberdarensis]